jgi:hypothetical protein
MQSMRGSVCDRRRQRTVHVIANKLPEVTTENQKSLVLSMDASL